MLLWSNLGRRQRVNELLAEGRLTAPDDYFHAALIFQHGDTLEDIWQAHELARKAAEMGATKAMGYKDSLWLAAAALDRWLMYQGKPQKYSTNFVPDGNAGGSGTSIQLLPMLNVPPIMFPLFKSHSNELNAIHKKTLKLQ
jgi:hypothetical protein